MDITYPFVRTMATGVLVSGFILSGVPGWIGIVLLVLGIVGLIFTWTYKLRPPRRIR